MTKLTETVTITREVPSHIADLVRFARIVCSYDVNTLEDSDLIRMARDFWESQHGED